MTFPFTGSSVKVTDDYFTERTNGLHRAWDLSAPYSSRIVAPENGKLLLLYMVRAGSPLPSHQEASSLLNNEAAQFSWYFADRYGAIAILLGAARWYVFTHLIVSDFFDSAFRRSLDIDIGKWRDTDASRFIEVYSNWKDQPLPAIREGEPIGLIGDSGYSTGPHCHFEICPAGYEDGAPSRIDPATLFPDRT